MYFLFKKSGFQFSNHNLDIKLNPSLTKSEHLLLKKLINDYKINYKKYFIITETNLELKNILLKKLRKLSRTSILFSYTNKESSEEILGSLNILNFFQEKDDFIITLSPEIKFSFETNNLWSRISLGTLICLDSSYSINLFKYLLKGEENKNYFEIEIDKLRKILEVEDDTYNRFYDLEKYIIKPAIENITNLDSNLSITYEKIKNGSGKNSKISSIKICFLNKYFENLHNNTNNIISHFSKYIKDFKNIYDLISQNLKIIPYEKIISIGDSCIQSNSFEKDFLEKLNLYKNKEI